MLYIVRIRSVIKLGTCCALLMEARKLVGWNVRRLRVAISLTVEDLADKARGRKLPLVALSAGKRTSVLLILAA